MFSLQFFHRITSLGSSRSLSFCHTYSNADNCDTHNSTRLTVKHFAVHSAVITYTVVWNWNCCVPTCVLQCLRVSTCVHMCNVSVYYVLVYVNCTLTKIESLFLEILLYCSLTAAIWVPWHEDTYQLGLQTLCRNNLKNNSKHPGIGIILE